MFKKLVALCLTAGLGAASAQTAAELRKILDRLDQVEAENRKLVEEIRALRSELGALRPAEGPALAERVDVQERRTEELAQSKVEAAQKFPISLTGMLLFNAFHNGHNAGTSEYPINANSATAMSPAGATLRQTVVGLAVRGPDLPWGGKASGSVFMDFFPGGATPGNNTLRLRLANLDLAWKNTTLSVGQDKPIIAPREPDSLAQVGISPLTGAGNLWDWQPQVRLEQRVAFSESAGVKLQGGIYQTSETDINLNATQLRLLERGRPGYEGRFEVYAGSGERRVEIAPGFHFSTSHFAGASIPARIASLDWKVKTSRQFELTGAWFRGQNVASLGALRQGYTILANGSVIPIHSQGSWGQAAYLPTAKLSFHLMSGAEYDRARDQASGGISRNFLYGGNLMYKLAPNIIGAFELTQTRTAYINLGNRINLHYDLAIAYQF